MKFLIKNATLNFPGHALHGKKVNLLTDGQKILGLDAKEKDANKVIDAKGMWLIPGMVDVQCHSGEPGHEDKENLDTLTKAAQAGGFTDLFILPSTDPVIDSKSEVKFIRNASGTNGVRLHALGAISKELEGKELSEMFDMHQAGAIAFTDGKRPVGDVNMMKRALFYSKNFGGIVMSFPHDERVAPGGMVNESTSNTALGIKSTPTLAEVLMLNRDLYLLEYSQSKMHVATISSKDSVELVSRSKKAGQDLSVGVAMANLLFTEERLSSFDTNFKTYPPLRSEKDRSALIKALQKGTIDMIVSDHLGGVIEDKDLEFDHAKPGMTMLETMLAAYQTFLSDELEFDTFVRATSINPRERFGLNMPELVEGAAFDFVLFDPKAKWTYGGMNKFSKSDNSPYLGQELTGRVIPVN